MKPVKAAFIVLLSLAGFSPCTAQFADSARYDYVRPPKAQQSSQVNLNNSLSFGVGIGGYYPYAGSYYVQSPSVSLSYENATFKHLGPGYISLGALASYKEITSNYTGNYTGYNYAQNWDYYILGARVAYHFNEILSTKIEPYAGAMLGYYITVFKFTSNDPDYTNPTNPAYYLTPNNYPDFFAPDIFAGISSPFSNRGSVWIELGYGYRTLAFGLSFKL